MLNYIFIYYIRFLLCNLIKNPNVTYDEIHFSAFNDSASIECIINSDSIIVSEIIIKKEVIMVS